MQEDKIIAATKAYVKSILNNDSSHDWWHVLRVWQVATLIAKQEKANLFIVAMAALLHDVEDWKFQDSNGSNKGIVAEWLRKHKIKKALQTEILDIIDNVSFQGAYTPTVHLSLEGKIVQDADRLDAMGAIGIARAFAYGGFKHREIHNPDVSPELHTSFAAYKKSNSTTINHFYEKLLLLKDKINTPTGKKIAEQRHKTMEQFLKQFFIEWNFHDCE